MTNNAKGNITAVFTASYHICKNQGGLLFSDVVISYVHIWENGN